MTTLSWIALAVSIAFLIYFVVNYVKDNKRKPQPGDPVYKDYPSDGPKDDPKNK